MGQRFEEEKKKNSKKRGSKEGLDELQVEKWSTAGQRPPKPTVNTVTHRGLGVQGRALGVGEAVSLPELL